MTQTLEKRTKDIALDEENVSAETASDLFEVTCLLFGTGSVQETVEVMKQAGLYNTALKATGNIIYNCDIKSAYETAPVKESNRDVLYILTHGE
jgi:hypothetical protein